MQDLILDLIALGFSRNESVVYVASLELGQAGAHEICAKAGVNRATVYSVLDSLKKKGLITFITSGDQRQYRAEAPVSILTLLELQQRELEKRQRRAHDIITRLQVFHNTDVAKPKIRYFERITGLRSMQAEYEMLNEDMIQIVGLDTLKQLYDPERELEHTSELKRRNSQVKTILVTKQDVSHFDLLENFQYVVVDPDLVDIKGEMTVCGDRLVLFSYTQGIIAVEIQSKTIADTARATLELAWNEAKRLADKS
ncbi:MAG: helix-turn-helix domain-containing protein [Patescibacteria group bacterium]